MDENIVKFQEKLRELVSLGKKKKGILEIQEINDFFSDMELDSDQMEKVFDYLEANNVDVLRISNDDDDIPDDIVMSDEDDIDVDDMFEEEDTNVDAKYPDNLADIIRKEFKELTDKQMKADVRAIISEYGKLNDVPEEGLHRIYDVIHA